MNPIKKGINGFSIGIFEKIITLPFVALQQKDHKIFFDSNKKFGVYAKSG